MRLRQIHRRAHHLTGEPRSRVAQRENTESHAEFGDLGCCAKCFARRTDLWPTRFALHATSCATKLCRGFKSMTPDPIFFLSFWLLVSGGIFFATVLIGLGLFHLLRH
jgi:hypothetical protein